MRFQHSAEEVWDLEARHNVETFSGLVDRVERKTGLNLRVLLKTVAPKFAHAFLSDENLDVNVVFLDLEEKLTTLVQETSPNTWKNFYQMAVLESYLEHLSGKYSVVVQEFEEIMGGSKEKTIPKWKKCLETSARRLTEAYSALYLRKHTSQVSIHCCRLNFSTVLFVPNEVWLV